MTRSLSLAGAAALALAFAPSIVAAAPSQPVFIDIGEQAASMAFDGKNIWVTNNVTDVGSAVIKVDAVTHAELLSIPVASFAGGMVFDGINVWVSTGDGLLVLRASDGTPVDTKGAFTGIHAIYNQSLAFDGTFIWAADADANLIYKIWAADPTAVVASYSVPEPSAIAFDNDKNVWAASFPGVVVKLRPCDGAVKARYTVGKAPRALAWDGSHMWVANSASNTVTRIGVGTFAVGQSARVALRWSEHLGRQQPGRRDRLRDAPVPERRSSEGPGGPRADGLRLRWSEPLGGERGLRHVPAARGAALLEPLRP
jgi:DNA-binding beta-propeller fold protein YncE